LVANVPDAALGSIRATGAIVHGHSVEIAANASGRLTLVMARGLTRVEGIAQRDGKPVPGAMVVLVPQKLNEEASLVRREQSDSDGTFTLASALPGKYTVVAIADGWNLKWMDPAVMQPYLKAGTPIEITSGRKYSVKVKVQ